MNEQIAKGLRWRARQTPTAYFINHPHTTRGVYRTLKKLWKKEHRHG